MWVSSVLGHFHIVALITEIIQIILLTVLLSSLVSEQKFEANGAKEQNLKKFLDGPT